MRRQAPASEGRAAIHWSRLRAARDFLLRPGTVLALYAIVTTTVTIAQLSKPFRIYGGRAATSINNFVIFKQSFVNLIGGADLYVYYPERYWDVYKYSPAFALLCAPFSLLPDAAGVMVWNLLNALALYWAVMLLPGVAARARSAILWYVLLDLVISLQNSQSNGLVAGLMILGFDWAAEKRPVRAALSIVLAVVVKLFGAVAFAALLLFEKRRALVVAALGWTLFFALVPLVAVSPSHLLTLYRSWLNLLAGDASTAIGLSVYGVLASWFGWHPPKHLVLLFGAVLLLLPLARRSAYRHPLFQRLLLSSVLLWVVIFNYRAESPMFVIAMSGVGIWFFTQKRRPWFLALAVVAYLLSSLSPTNVVPSWLRVNLVLPYLLKCVPCIVVWLTIQWQLLLSHFEPAEGTGPGPLQDLAPLPASNDKR